MKLHARFAKAYGWCPNVRGYSRGEVELGLMVNLVAVSALETLGIVDAVNCVFSGEALADLAQRAGANEKDVIRLKLQAMKSENKTHGQGQGQWQ